MSKESVYICFSCDGEISEEQIERAKKKGEFKGTCDWCKKNMRMGKGELHD